MTKEELLEKAKRDYPAGTKFISRYGRKDVMTVTINNHTIYNSGQGSTLITVSTDIGNGGKLNDRYATLYDFIDNKWAEIVSRPEPEKWEPKVGDWGVCYSGHCCKITHIDDMFYYTTNKYHKHANRDGSDTSWVNKGDKAFRPALPHEIPQEEEEVEYIEAAVNKDDHLTRGKIYPVINISNCGEFYRIINDNGSQDGYSIKYQVNPSTRQAYEAQQGKHTEIETIRDFCKPIVNNISQINQSKNEKTKCNTKITIQDLISCGEDYSFPTGKRRTGAKIQLEGCVLPSKSRPVRG